MTFLPIAERELRVQARQNKTYWLRLANAAVAIALVSFMLLVNQGFSTPGSLGHGLFAVLAWLTFLFCLLTGVGQTADCLSEEKREGTLGLLFLTDLKGYDVVLGKLFATSLNNLYGVVASFPPLAITFCLGGVTAGEFWRLVLLLIITMLFSLALGMFVSALSRDEQRAWLGAVCLLGLLAVLPVSGLLSLFDTRYRFNRSTYWQMLSVLHGLSWLLLAAASIILPRAWQDTGKMPRKGHFFGNSLGRVRLRARASAATEERTLHPVLWLAVRQTGSGQASLWMVVAGAGGLGILTAAFGLDAPPVLWTLFGCALGLHCLLAIWMAFQASHILAEARRSGTLELLLVTPLRDNEIIENYFLGLKKMFLRPVGALLGIEAIILGGALGFWSLHHNGGGTVIPILLAAGFCAFLFISDLYAMGRFGMWMGLRVKKPTQAFFKTVLYVMVLPLFSVVCCTVLTPVVGLVKNAIFMNYAEMQMLKHFRALLTEGKVSKREAERLPPVLEGADHRSQSIP